MTPATTLARVPRALPVPPGQTPRRWQGEALPAMLGAVEAGYTSVLVSAATGTGKGTLIAGFAQLCAAAGLRALILAHREELVTEIPDRIRKIPGATSTGIVMAERHEPHARIVAASVQSCTPGRRPSMGAFDVILTDEAHHATAPSYQDVRAWVASKQPGALHFGFTATPFRAGADGSTRGLGRVFQALAYEHTIAAAIADGDLVPLEAWDASTLTDLSGVDLDDDDEVARRVNNPARNQLVVDQYLLRTPGLPALVFGASIAHAEHLAEAFRAAGVRAAAVSSETPTDQRRELIARYRSGALSVLCSKDLLFEGFDAPATRAIYKARPTRSPIVFQQMVGRGLRTFGVNFADEPPEVRRAVIAASIKPRCVLVDLVDNGCEMQLVGAADLTDEGDEGTTDPRPIGVGDRVRRRHHDDWGVGTVLAVLDGPLARATVQWPRHRLAPDGQTLTHPTAELRRVAGEEAAEPAPIVIKPRSLGVRAFQLFLLPKDDGPGLGDVHWYEHNGALTAGGQANGGVRLTCRVAAGEVWAVTYDPSHPVPAQRSRAARLAHGLERVDGLRLAQEHLRAHGVTLAPVDRAWAGDPATPAQAQALQGLGIRRDFSRLSKSEAGALLLAVAARRAVDEAKAGAHRAELAAQAKRRAAVFAGRRG